MAVWEVRVVYRNGDRFWENVWDIDVGSATDVPPSVIAAFQYFALHTLRDVYSLSKIVRRPAGTTDEFIEVIIEAAGLVLTDSAKVLPLWNTVRLLLEGGVGRVGTKFLRGYLTNADLADEQNHISSSALSSIQGEADTLFDAIVAESCHVVFGAAHKVAASPVVQTVVQMRQPHRKRRKSA